MMGSLECTKGHIELQCKERSPLKLCRGLVVDCFKKGIKIFEDTHVPYLSIRRHQSNLVLQDKVRRQFVAQIPRLFDCYPFDFSILTLSYSCFNSQFKIIIIIDVRLDNKKVISTSNFVPHRYYSLIYYLNVLCTCDAPPPVGWATITGVIINSVSKSSNVILLLF